MYCIFKNIDMTEGVKHFADAHECHWLATDIAAYSLGIAEPCQFWTLAVGPQDARLSCVADEGEPELHAVENILTDMPPGEHRLWLFKEHGGASVLMLPEEY